MCGRKGTEEDGLIGRVSGIGGVIIQRNAETLLESGERVVEGAPAVNELIGREVRLQILRIAGHHEEGRSGPFLKGSPKGRRKVRICLVCTTEHHDISVRISSLVCGCIH